MFRVDILAVCRGLADRGAGNQVRSPNDRPTSPGLTPRSNFPQSQRTLLQGCDA